ncbi:uncharacterized protein [Bombus flavifrons]|uniref:uncharacterized protein n=1 Tax=Bombus flavifrons TaxID=103934 RepID=UPI003703C1A5
MTEASLVFLSCWEAIEPGFTAAQRLDPKCMRKDNMARAYLFRHIRPEFIGEIKSLKTARDCWKALEDVHRRSTSMDTVLCIRELGTIEKNPDMDVGEYCGKIYDLCEKISNAGLRIEDHMMACFILAGLVSDPNYATYLRTVRLDKNLTSRVVKSDLLLEERRMEAAMGLSEKNSAMAVCKQSKTKPQQSQDGTKKKHKNPKNKRCYKCGKRGHISYNCQEGKEDKEGIDPENKVEDKPRSKGLISTLALSSINHVERDRISYLDSGASNHMTPDRYRFVDFVPAAGQIRIGKGYLEVKGKGTIVVKMTKACGGWSLSLSNALWVPELDVNLISIRQLAVKGVTTVCTKDEAVGTHDDGDVVFNSKVGDNVYYLETIPPERHAANVSMENDQEEPGNDNDHAEVIEAKAYKGIVSWHERLGHLHGNAMRKIPVRSVKEDSRIHEEPCGSA